MMYETIVVLKMPILFKVRNESLWIFTGISEVRRGEKQMAEPVCGGTPTPYEHRKAHLVRLHAIC